MVFENILHQELSEYFIWIFSVDQKIENAFGQNIVLGKWSSNQSDLLVQVGLINGLLDQQFFKEIKHARWLNPSDARVEVVFYWILGSAQKRLADLGPRSLAHLELVEDGRLLVDGPVAFFDFRIQDVDPSFSALLPAPSENLLRAVGPLLGPSALHPVQ